MLKIRGKTPWDRKYQNPKKNLAKICSNNLSGIFYFDGK